MGFNQFINSIKGERGATSLISVMILASASLIAIGAVTSLLIKGRDLTSIRTNVNTYEDFIINTKQLLENPQACTTYLRNRTISRTPGMKSDITLDMDMDGTTVNDVGPDWEDPSGTFEVRNVYIETLGGRVRTVRPWNSPATHLVYPVRIVIQPKKLRVSLEKADPSVFGEEHQSIVDTYKKEYEDVNPLVNNHLDIRLLVHVNQRGQIRQCYGYDTYAAVCTASGGTYDVNETNARLKCKPDKRCYADNRKGMNKLVNDKSMCRPPYNDSKGVTSVGKIQGQDKYLCGWCHPYAGVEGKGTKGHGEDGPEEANGDWLEEQILEVAQELSRLQAAGVPASDARVVELAAKWDYLIQAAMAGGHDVDGEEKEYLEAADLMAKHDQATKNVELFENRINNISSNYEEKQTELKSLKDDRTSAKNALKEAKANLANLEKEAREKGHSPVSSYPGHASAKDRVVDANKAFQQAKKNYNQMAEEVKGDKSRLSNLEKKKKTAERELSSINEQVKEGGADEKVGTVEDVLNQLHVSPALIAYIDEAAGR